MDWGELVAALGAVVLFNLLAVLVLAGAARTRRRAGALAHGSRRATIDG